MSGSLRERLAQGQTLLGLNHMYPGAGIVEGMCPGWDFIWIDTQHGQMSYDATLASVRTAHHMGLETIVRPPSHEATILGIMADLAPSGLMVPMVNSVQDAQRTVRAVHFPPLGDRSYGGRRPIDLHGREYYRNNPVFVLAQIETLEAVEAAEQIIATDGIDGLFFGPDDMKVRMGLPIDTSVMENARLQEAMRHTAAAAKKVGKFAGGIAATVASLHLCRQMGYQILIGGGDVMFLRASAAAKLAELRGALNQQSNHAGCPTGAGPY
ncbi:MAG: hypothetical protein IT446_09955 [Phycisphaerales bacterium]|nr:hypothetical protein [Phycisphaerales bacterium]